MTGGTEWAKPSDGASWWVREGVHGDVMRGLRRFEGVGGEGSAHKMLSLCVVFFTDSSGGKPPLWDDISTPSMG